MKSCILRVCFCSQTQDVSTDRSNSKLTSQDSGAIAASGEFGPHNQRKYDIIASDLFLVVSFCNALGCCCGIKGVGCGVEIMLADHHRLTRVRSDLLYAK